MRANDRTTCLSMVGSVVVVCMQLDTEARHRCHALAAASRRDERHHQAKEEHREGAEHSLLRQPDLARGRKVLPAAREKRGGAIGSSSASGARAAEPGWGVGDGASGSGLITAALTLRRSPACPPAHRSSESQPGRLRTEAETG